MFTKFMQTQEQAKGKHNEGSYKKKDIIVMTPTYNMHYYQ